MTEDDLGTATGGSSVVAARRQQLPQPPRGGHPAPHEGNEDGHRHDLWWLDLRVAATQVSINKPFKDNVWRLDGQGRPRPDPGRQNQAAIHRHVVPMDSGGVECHSLRVQGVVRGLSQMAGPPQQRQPEGVVWRQCAVFPATKFLPSVSGKLHVPVHRVQGQ